jgi:alpha-tubulin suppressor-like RCC1 family protein
VWCWGDNGAYQSGNTNGGMVDVPALVSTGYNAHTDLAVGGMFTCAIAGTNKTVCWGDDTHCIINGGCSGRFGPTGGTPGGFATSVNLISLNAGAAFICAVAKNGGPAATFCWGASGQWQITNGGLDFANAVQEPWTDVFTQGAGESQVCAQDPAGFRCWGNNATGQANGNPNNPGKIDPFSAPVQAFPDAKAVVVAGGTGFTCGISGPRDAYCWGENGKGQLGGGTVTPMTGFQKVNGLKDVQSIAAGGTHTCAIAHNLTETSSDPMGLYCWGNNVASQVDPVGQKPPITKPARISFPPYQ